MQSYPEKNVRGIRLIIFALVSVGLLISGRIGLISAQQDPCAKRKVFVSVEDEKGQPVSVLTAKDFHATLGKIELPVIGAEPAPPRRVVILLDHSGSMRHDYTYRISAIAITNLVKRAAPGTQFAFATYNNNFQLLNKLSADHEELSEYIKNILAIKTSYGTSAMLDAVVRGLEVLTPSGPTDAVLVITDGDDNASRISWEDAERRFAGSDVRLFMVVIIDGKAPGYVHWHDEEKNRRIENFVNTVGGDSFFVGTLKPSNSPHPKRIEYHIEEDFHNLPDIADSILHNMASNYLLEISVTSTFVKPEDWKLELVGNRSGNDHGLFVRYQPKLYPCSLTTAPK